MTFMVRVLGLLTCVLSLIGADPAITEGERLYTEGSYRLAHDAFTKASSNNLSPEAIRWLRFRLAETSIRSELATRQPDDSARKSAEDYLKQLIEEGAKKDRIWAEAEETFGDLQRGSRGNNNPGGAWPHYAQALDYWAGSTNLVLGADKYWSILRKAAEPPQVEPMWYFGSYGMYIPPAVLENALKIARNEEERARAHFMLAMTLRAQGGEWEQRFRIPREFDEALVLKKDTRWYDDALYFYGEWMSRSGRAVQDENGNWRMEPDFEKALELFRRLVTEFRKGETPWFDDAQNRIHEITREDVDVNVSNVFLPGSEMEFHFVARNVESIEFTIYEVDLGQDFSFSGENSEWQHGFSPERAKKVKSWKKTLDKGRPYAQSSDTVRLEESLPAGAYVLAARGGNVSDREMLLVTDAGIVVEGAGRQALVYACHSGTGAPLRSSHITLWERYHDGKRWKWAKHSKEADSQGLALFEFKEPHHGSPTLFASMKNGAKQAFSYGAINYWPPESEGWKIFAFPDKPAYRPGEKVQWKIIARRHRGETYAVPSGQKLRFRMLDARGAELSKETITLNEFGSAWGKFELKSDLPLGEFQAVFLTEDGRREIGRAILFRLEEYKLPEFKVAVRAPEENGRRKTFLLGETVEVEIAAEYYFGGPVPNASAEIVIYQSPSYHIWTEPREFPWFYTDRDQRYRPQYGRQVMQRETIKTDAQGKAKLMFPTPLGAGNDLEYQIEARVTDASRREVTASDRVRVARQRFYVYPVASRQLYKPQDKVEVQFRSADANDQPVSTEGTVQVTRDFWYEVWVSPDGREVEGQELKKLQSAKIFPPVPLPGQRPWRMKFRGYQHDPVLTRTVRSDTNGMATLVFTAEREGYYRVNWRTDEVVKADSIPSRPIRAETTVWVASGQSADIGYRSGRLEIVVDKDTFRAGQKAAVMLSAPGNDRYVLLTTTGGDLLDYQLVHLTGSVKLIEVEVREKHVPNFFLNGTMIADQELAMDQKELIVPPTKNFLNVDVDADRPELRPGEKGTLRIRTRDSEGNAVPAEVALSVFDESVSYIQQEISGDPRQFFFGTKRQNLFSSSSSFNYRTYRKAIGDDEARDEERAGTMREARSYRFDKDGRAGLQGGTATALDMLMRQEVISQNRGLDLRDLASMKQLGERPMLAKAAAAPANEAAMEPAVEVRTDFRSAIFWEPALRTDQNGRAEISVTYPDSLTSWKAVARVVTKENQFGVDDTLTRTKQPLTVRLQAPRFFLVGDTVTISAVINNNTAETLVVSPTIEAKGIGIDGAKKQTVQLNPGGEDRVDWTIRPKAPGDISVKVTARGGRYADAMEKPFPVYEHGIEKFLAISGKGRGSEVRATLDLPAERKAGSTRFTVQVTPSLAVTMLDALPYLVRFPYGCTEQTMSRFLPAMITAKTLKDLKLNPEDVMNRVFGGIEQGNTNRFRPAAKKNMEQLNEIARKGLDRLADFQHADGGWGWWKDGESDRFMTAYVVWGLALARTAGVEVAAHLLTKGADFLNLQLVEVEKDYDLQAFMLHALAAVAELEHRSLLSAEQQTAFDNLWENRDQLNAYTRALFALSSHAFEKRTEATILVRNLINGVTKDNNSGQSALLQGRVQNESSSLRTAHWGEDGIHHRWSEGGVEATAFALRALLAIDPKNVLIEPVANWLIKNRRGAQWSNTRDTAIVLLALNDYLRTTGEVQGELEYEVFVNGTSFGSHKISGTNIFSAPREFMIPEKETRTGKNEIRIQRKSGEAPIYFAAQCTFFSLEEPIIPAGNEIFVNRRYYRLIPTPTLLKGYAYEKQELAPGDRIDSGERIETVVTIETKNNYEYLVFEDLKPSGLEAVEIRSGEPLFAHQLRSRAVAREFQGSPVADNDTEEPILQNDRSEAQAGQRRWVYQELRDRKVALFIDKLPEGFWEIRYEGRAEVPGEFHALPVVGHAMYVPEIRGNSAETRIVVQDKMKGQL